MTGESKMGELLRALTIQALLALLWAVVVVTAYVLWITRLWTRGGTSTTVEFGSLLAIGAGMLPYLLSYWVSLILSQRSNRVRCKLWTSAQSDADQTNLYKRASALWDFESDRFQRILHQASDYVFLFGSMASIVIEFCAISYIIVRTVGKHGYSADQVALTVGVGTSALVYFAVSFGNFLQRASNLDANARLFAGACRNLLLVIPSSFFLIGIMCSSAALKELCSNDFGAALVGAAIGLLGDRIFGEVTDRAANFLGVKNLTPQHTSDLRQIDGLNDEDVARLGEEGVDSVHALAFAPTPRLFFNTIYSLQCICDWQDQALLIEFMGPAKVQTFREKFMVRGVLDARMIVRQILGSTKGAAIKTKYALSPVAAADKTEISKLLGFNTEIQMELAFLSIAEDEVIARLAIYNHSTVHYPDDAKGKQAPVTPILAGQAAA